MQEKKDQAPTVRRLTQAPPPERHLSGSGTAWFSPTPKPSEAPQWLPPSYPYSLKVRTTQIIGKAFEKFPKQSEISDTCKLIISDLTPIICGDAEEGVLGPGRALSHMEELLSHVLTGNCQDSSQELLEIKKTDEWNQFLERLASAEAATNRSSRKALDPAGGPPQDEMQQTYPKSDIDGAAVDDVETRSMIDRFLGGATLKSGRNIPKKLIWLLAGYKDASGFEDWQAGRSVARITRDNFLAVLKLTPEEAVRRYDKMTSKNKNSA